MYLNRCQGCLGISDNLDSMLGVRGGFPNKSVLFMMAVIGAASVSVPICQQRKLPSPYHSWVLLLDKSHGESHFDVGFLFANMHPRTYVADQWPPEMEALTTSLWCKGKIFTYGVAEVIQSLPVKVLCFLLCDLYKCFT